MWRPDDVWRRQTDRVREMLRRDFDTVWLLSDSTDASRVLAAGFDGGAPYAAFSPQQYPQLARAFSGLNLTFSPSIGTGFDALARHAPGHRSQNFRRGQLDRRLFDRRARLPDLSLGDLRLGSAHCYLVWRGVRSRQTPQRFANPRLCLGHL